MRAQEFLTELFGMGEPKKNARAHRDGIDLEIIDGVGAERQINARSHGVDLGRVVFDVQFQGKDTILIAKDLMILPKYRGQGIAAIMYDWAKELGYKVERSPEQTDAGKHFWDKNRGEEGQVWEAEQKTLDPEIYKELPNTFLKRIVQHALPGVQLKFRNTPEGYLSVRADDDSVKLDIGTSIADGDIGFNIENAYLTKHQGAGIMTKIISDAYQAIERRYGKPKSRSLNIMQDRSHGAWQAIANKLGAEYGANRIDESVRAYHGTFQPTIEDMPTGARAPLYHTSPIIKAIKIIDGGAIKPIKPFDSPDPRNPNSGKPSISLTRDPRLNYHSTTGGSDRVTFVIDQDALRQITKIYPITYPGIKRQESEERVYNPIPLRVVTAIIVPKYTIGHIKEIKQILKDRGDWINDEVWNDDSYGKIEWMLDYIMQASKKQGIKIIVK